LEVGERMKKLAPNKKYTVNYTMTHSDGGYRYTFFCALCDFHYKTGWISADAEAEARGLAEKEARPHFNGCHACGRWICDGHYDRQAMLCVECTKN
jgi:hypothetical protein